MYFGTDLKRKINPRIKANFLSIITFFYTRSLVKLCRKRDLVEEDVYEITSKFNAETLGDQIEQEWHKEATPNEKTLIKTLWRCYGHYYLLLGIVQLTMKTLVTTLQPMALGRLVSFFTASSEMSKTDAYYYAALLIGINIVNVTYAHNYMQLVNELGIRVRTAVSSLIYRKSIKLSSSAITDVSIGKIVTLITKDILIFDSILTFINDIWISVIMLIYTTVLIYRKLGVSTFAGIGFLLAIIPLQIIFGKLTTKFRLVANKTTDQRLQLTQESLSAIKIIKMYTWEKYYGDKIEKKRKTEVQQIKINYYSKAASLIIGGLVTNITMYIIVATYTHLGHFFTAEVAFYLLTCLYNLRSVIMVSIPLGIVQTAELFASITRINKLLLAKEHQGAPFDEVALEKRPLVELKDVRVVLKDKIILDRVDVKLKVGLNVLTGRVGGGKSSLLKTILRDYPLTSGTLLTSGSISYAGEEPWLFPSSIRQNILFGQAYDDARYLKVLEICALTTDVATFEEGDQTILDDRGMNLSKGQQARINLARAVYKDSDIYLLDDCLNALDAHVQEFVFTECIRKFLKEKLVLMITHNEGNVRQADRILVMENGVLKTCEKNELTLQVIGDGGEEKTPKANDIIDEILEGEGEEEALLKEVKKRNIYREEKQEGKVKLDVYKRYVKYGGTIWLFMVVLILFVLSQFAISFSDKLVTQWTTIQQNISDCRAENKTNTNDYSSLIKESETLFSKYSLTVIIATLLLVVRALTLFDFVTRASRKLHKAMIKSMMHAKMHFFDTYYIGNILNRFSKDLGTLDEYLPFLIYECLRLFCTVVGIMVLITSVNYLFLIATVLVSIKLYIVRRLYIPVGRSLKRLDSATRSPMLGHLNATLEGLTTIRALQTQNTLIKEFDTIQNLYVSTCYMSLCCQRGFAYILDMSCVFFVTSIILKFLIFDLGNEAGEVGLAITQALMLTGLLQWAIRQWAELETQMTAVERVLEYVDVEQENATGVKPADWPSAGALSYRNVNLSYGNLKENVLKNIDFVVEPGEKVGIVGRTGAGKSSLISTLFRLYASEGTIEIDGVDIRTVALEVLRSKIAIIPQDPVLFSGTIRTNIDPMGRFEDDEIWCALEAVKLKPYIGGLNDGINDNGVNFSSGQRQLLCLARAIITRNQIIVLDEATANMDPEMDALIRQTIAESFAKCTVLTIAHRLHSVLDGDKIMVVDKGEIVEFDAPQTLLDNSNGVFYKMVKRANLV